jgi:hypothetical protein
VTGAGNRIAWLLSLGLAAAGCVAAHVLAYRVTEPHAERREHLLEETGHGYLDLTLVGSLCTALVAVGFVGGVLASAGRAGRPPLWLFALAPFLGFTLQEHVERALHHDALLLAVLEPTFLAGLLLQLPFALAALLAARALFAAAAAVARHLGTPPRTRLAPDASLALPGTFWIPASPALIGARGQRAPPHRTAF